MLGLSESDLSVFETVTEITGYLQIEAEAVTHVDYFRNLTVIRGIETIPLVDSTGDCFNLELRICVEFSLKLLHFRLCCVQCLGFLSHDGKSIGFK